MWRGENTQRGRYREFMQCDFDTIGTRSVAADAETVLVAHDLLRAIGFDRFTIHVNNRLVLNGLLESLGLADRATEVLRAIDKLTKIGAEKVIEEMTQSAGASPGQAEQVVEMVQITGSNDAILTQLRSLVGNSHRGFEGIDRLAELWAAVRSAGVPAERVKLDVSIARGLDYYTGTVMETLLDDLPAIGSICSGGRYDNLAELYTKQELPGIGASLGLDRLLAAMEELGMLAATQTPAQVFIPYFDAGHLGDYFKLAADLRAAGLATEVYPEPAKLGKQLQYADRKGFRVAVIAGEREFEAGECQVKNMAEQNQHQRLARRSGRSHRRTPRHLGVVNRIVYNCGSVVRGPLSVALIQHLLATDSGRLTTDSHYEPRQSLRGRIRGVSSRSAVAVHRRR